MNISRNEVQTFRYSSSGSLPISKTNLVFLGTANNTDKMRVYVTDLKCTCATAATIKIFTASATNMPLLFKLPANSVTDFSWEIPPSFLITSSTVEKRRVVASANGTGVFVSISGYYEK